MNAIAWTDQRRQPCPACGRGPRDKTFAIKVDAQGCVAYCHRCHHVEHTGEARDLRKRSFHSLVPPTQRLGLSAFGRELWGSCGPLVGVGLAYLEARRCVVPPKDGHLRFHPSLAHKPSGLRGPALVALVTDVISGEPLTLHRTWIQANGEKAAFDPPRLLLGGHRKMGGVVRLWPDEEVTLALGVAEGIESALSLAHAFSPVWACIDAANLAKFQVLEGIESLVIAADHDLAGIDAANMCARRWTEAGKEVGIALPSLYKTDFNDLVRAA